MAPPPTRIGRYEVASRLGEGGMGVVYLARDPHLQRMVAIKMLQTGEGSGAPETEIRQRFTREAQAIAALKHTHIVTIYDVGEDEGRPFIAMEYLDGESLADLIRRRAPLDLTRRVELVLQLCGGLAYAHRHGIIHRDIKPANLAVTNEGILKILDFGLARAAANTGEMALTQVGTVMGTPHYMSPEQIGGKPLDQRTDIFAVGAVLYEVLTYEQAFSAETPLVVLHRILHDEPVPLRERRPDLDPEFDRIVARALAKSRDERYESLNDLARELQHLMGQATRPIDVSVAVRAVGTDATVKLPKPAFDAASASEDGRTIVMPASPRAMPAARGPSRLWLAGAALVVAVLAAAAYAVWPNASAGSSPGPAVSSSPPAGDPSQPTLSPSSPPASSPSATGPASTPAPPGDRSTPAGPPVASQPPPDPPARGAQGVATRGTGDATRPAAETARPATASSAKDPDVAARCTDLLRKISVGEQLTPAESTFMTQRCR